jgi:uncharacterized membrane protein
MAARVSRIAVSIRHSLWAQPTLMMVVALALGVLLPALDRALPSSLHSPAGWGRWVGGSGAGVRETLATSATALATILAVSVTTTMVVIQLAAGMYTSRLLRRFLGDRPIRLLLGSFTGSVLYLVLVLGAVRSAPEGQEFVPLVSVLLGRLLTVACLVLLIVFVHYTARSIQAATIVRRVAQDALDAARRLRGTDLFSAGFGGTPRRDGPGCVVRAKATGYVQIVDEDQLIAALPDTVRELRLDAGPGDFLFLGTPLVTVWGDGETAAPPLPEDVADRVRDAFATGRERTIEEDPGFAVRQLTDIAVKALSPGVNDPTTAEMVVNELGALVADGAAAGEIGDWRGSSRNGRTVWARRYGVAPVLNALGQVAEAGARHARVLARALEILSVVRATTDGCELHAALDQAARHVAAVADWSALPEPAAVVVRDRLQAFEAGVSPDPAPRTPA